MSRNSVLRIGQVVLDALWHVWRLKVEIAWVLLMPALAIGVLTYFLFRFWGSLDSETHWLVYAARWLVLAFAAVSCHRLVLLGPGSVAKLGVSGWNVREWIFLLLLLVVSAIASVGAFAAGTVAALAASLPLNLFKGRFDQPLAMFIMSVAILGAAYVLARVSLVLPARAIDERLGLRESWTLTKANAWRLALLVGLLPWAMRRMERLLAESFESAGAAWTVATALYVLMLPIEIAVLSVSYRTLKTSAAASRAE